MYCREEDRKCINKSSRIPYSIDITLTAEKHEKKKAPHSIEKDV